MVLIKTAYQSLWYINARSDTASGICCLHGGQ